MKTTLLFTLLFTSTLSAQYIMPINDNEIAQGNFGSLQNLKQELKDVQIVGLGEGGHWVGTTFEAKVAMIKYLHDSLGFDAIAFESPLYDLKVINDSLKLGSISKRLFFDGIYSIWNCDEVGGLYEYLNMKSTKPGDHIDFIGIDNQLGRNALRFLKGDFETLFDSLQEYSSEVLGSTKFYQTLDGVIRTSNMGYSRKEDTTYFCKQLRTVIGYIDDHKLDVIPYYKFWKQLCLNIITDYNRSFHKPFGILRDSMMYCNVAEYAIGNPEKKIVIWAATGHLTYDHDDKALRMGDFLKKRFNKGYYVMAFTQYSGEIRGWIRLKVKRSTRSGLEYHIREKYDGDFGIVSFRDQRNIDFMRENRVNKIKVIRKEMKVNPEDYADALFYIKEMKPVNYWYYKNH